MSDRVLTEEINEETSNDITASDSLQHDTSRASQPLYPTSDLTSFIVDTPSLECDNESDEQMNQNFHDRGDLGYPYNQLSTIQDGISNRELETPPPYFAGYTPMLGGHPNYRVDENELQSRSTIDTKLQPKELQRKTQQQYSRDLGFEKDFPHTKRLIESNGNFSNCTICLMKFFSKSMILLGLQDLRT